MRREWFVSNTVRALSALSSSGGDVSLRSVEPVRAQNGETLAAAEHSV